jgi:hypothetical protein
VLRALRVLPDEPVLKAGSGSGCLRARVRGWQGKAQGTPLLCCVVHCCSGILWLTPPGCSFHTDPSGTYVKYEAKAIGSGSEGAQTALQESYR